MTDLRLLAADGATRSVELGVGLVGQRPGCAPRGRVAYAAAHVVPVPWAENVPGHPATIDWDATLAFRHHVWSWGLGVADAMDTAQRNMGLDWDATRELIRRSAAEAATVGGAIVAGVNTDQLDGRVGVDGVTTAYLEQLETVEEAGAGAVLMASRHLAAAAQTPADYERVYGDVLSRAGGPVVLHWLGAAFDPLLEGYFGPDQATAERTVLNIIHANAGTVSGIKMSLLDAGAEIRMRRQLPEGVSMYTGDDFHYVDLIAGDEIGYSDALLGAFAAITPTAALALERLDAGDAAGYRALLEPTEELSRQIFAAPTQYYKTGVAFLSWLNGHQSSPAMVGGLQTGRSLPHLSGIIERANRAGVLEAPQLAADRWHRLLDLHGI